MISNDIWSKSFSFTFLVRIRLYVVYSITSRLPKSVLSKQIKHFAVLISTDLFGIVRCMERGRTVTINAPSPKAMMYPPKPGINDDSSENVDNSIPIDKIETVSYIFLRRPPNDSIHFYDELQSAPNFSNWDHVTRDDRNIFRTNINIDSSIANRNTRMPELLTLWSVATCNGVTRTKVIRTFLWIAAITGIVTNMAPIWSSQLSRYIFFNEQSSINNFSTMTPLLRKISDRIRNIVPFVYKPKQIQPVHVVFRTYHDDDMYQQNYHANVAVRTKPKYHRPIIVIHIGPHQTDSKLLQAELTYYQDQLQVDNFQYIGRLHYSILNKNTSKWSIQGKPDSKLQSSVRDMIHQCWQNTKRQCAEDVLHLLLNRYRKPKKALPNLLISDDDLFNLLVDDTDRDNHERKHPNATNFECLRERNENFVAFINTFRPYWDIRIVATYRRFYEWLPYMKYHNEEPPIKNNFMMEWPVGTTEVSISSSHNDTGYHHRDGVPQPLFPLWTDNATDTERQTQAMLNEWKNKHFLSVRDINTIRQMQNNQETSILRIFHAYGKLSLRTNFLCNVIPYAYYSCDASRREDRVPARRLYSHDDTSGIYPYEFFDAIAVASASMKLINTSVWDRPTVAHILYNKYYHNQQQQFHTTSAIHRHQGQGANARNPVLSLDAQFQYGHKENVWDLPLLCPQRQQLDLLLRTSIEIEARHLKKLHRKSMLEHRAAFNAATQSKQAISSIYCWVDIHTLLLKEENGTNHNANRRTNSPWRNYITETFT
jgi:hypothetical protein